MPLGNNDYTWHYICSCWFLDIRISTCLILLYPLELQTQEEENQQEQKQDGENVQGHY